MDTAVRFMLAAILLLAMVNHTHADTGRDDAEVVLEADEIDRSTVEVGAFVVVVYGQGEQHPTSGEWAKLDTIRGYIKAVRQRSLILSLERYGWPESIALDRIQTLTLVESPASVRTDDMGVGKRIAVKLVSGAFAGSVSSLSGAGLGRAIENCPEYGDPDDWCGVGGALWGGTFGLIAGTTYGVSRIDPHDRFFFPLLGSLMGLGAGIWLTANSDGELWPSIFVGPVAFATMMSELSRKPPQARRFSVGLVPNSNGHLSAVATLRF